MACMNAFRARIRAHAVEWFVSAVLWGSVLSIAWAGSNLVEAIIDTIRYGHPR